MNEDLKELISTVNDAFDLITQLEARLKAVEEKKLPIGPRIAELETTVAKQAAAINGLTAYVNMLNSRTFGSVRMGGR